jgi:hypothetical protein
MTMIVNINKANLHERNVFMEKVRMSIVSQLSLLTVVIMVFALLVLVTRD